MESELQRIRNWASHGTVGQFYTEVSAKLSKHPYTAERAGNTITFFRLRTEGGVLGIGKRKVKEPVFTLTREGDQVSLHAEPGAEEFTKLLARLLSHH